MTPIILLLTMLVSVPKQGDDTISLNSNRTAVLRLDGSGAFAETAYTSPGGEVVTLTAASGGALDVVLELAGPDGAAIAYADAPGNDDVSLVRVRLDQPGLYLARLNTFNGEGVGDVTLTLTVHEPHILTPDTPLLWLPLGAGDIAVVALDGFGDSPVTITARDPRGLLDPRLVLLAADGTTAAENDDHHGSDPALNRFDARLVGAPTSGDQMLVITEFLGRSGWLEVSIRP